MRKAKPAKMADRDARWTLKAQQERRGHEPAHGTCLWLQKSHQYRQAPRFDPLLDGK